MMIICFANDDPHDPHERHQLYMCHMFIILTCHSSALCFTILHGLSAFSWPGPTKSVDGHISLAATRWQAGWLIFRSPPCQLHSSFCPLTQNQLVFISFEFGLLGRFAICSLVVETTWISLSDKNIIDRDWMRLLALRKKLPKISWKWRGGRAEGHEKIAEQIFCNLAI